MKCDTKASANATAIVGGAAYLICVVWVYFSKSSYMGVMSSWFHGVDFKGLPAKQLELGSAFWGFITFTVFLWLVGYFWAYFYNKFTKLVKVYTCPMHPEVISDKPGKCPKCGTMDLVLKAEV